METWFYPVKPGSTWLYENIYIGLPLEKNKGNSREIKGLPRFPETVRIGLKLVILAAYHEIYQIKAISQNVKKRK